VIDGEALTRLRFRVAGAADAEGIAALHADSWRRHYRGAYSNAFLDGDVEADRLAVWTTRLGVDDPLQHTVVVHDDDTLVGFVHVVLDDDPCWGSLIDNLHVTSSLKRRGLGTRLMKLAAAAVVEKAEGSGLYLWVLEQNTDAQAFYRSLGGVEVERAFVGAPGGVPARLIGSPAKLRVAWPAPVRLSA
jgi:ribosomal protein S18 acetylase RimI-like enzyme